MVTLTERIATAQKRLVSLKRLQAPPLVLHGAERYLNCLQVFLDQYGPDFFEKLPLYQTAQKGGLPVKLVAVLPDILMVQIKPLEGPLEWVSVFQLTDFLL